MTPTKTKEEIKPEIISKRVAEIISKSKFLCDTKYYKTNKTSIAAWDSWAARGQAGGCGCCDIGHYNCTIYNTRNSRNKKGMGSWSWNKVSPNLCSACYAELLKQVNYKFKTY